MELKDSISKVKGIGPKKTELLGKLNFIFSNITLSETVFSNTERVPFSKTSTLIIFFLLYFFVSKTQPPLGLKI